jgi:hypothetical protein
MLGGWCEMAESQLQGRQAVGRESPFRDDLNTKAKE